MLVSLFVKDFAIVNAVEAGFSAGLTVVSGETGAGKSLLVDALLLLTGQRADASMVRAGAERAELTARFAPAPDSPALQWLRRNDLDEDGECLLRRTIRADGGSRAYINGRPATATQLAELGALLVEIHGQHAHQALLERGWQLRLLDAAAAHGDTLALMKEAARRWNRIKREIEELRGRGDPAQRRDELARQLQEMAHENLAPSAIEELIAAHRRHSHSAALIEGCGRAADALSGDGAMLSGLRRVRSELARLVDHEPRLSEVDILLDSAAIQLDEAASALDRLRDDLELDPERLAELEAKLSRLHELSRKHRTPLDGLAQRRDELQAEFDALSDSDETLARLEREREAAAAEWRTLATQVSTARATAAERLSREVSERIATLGMGGGRFSIELESTGDGQPHPDGLERAEFQVSANPGQPLRPLRKVASGGELSRISLAIEVAMLGQDNVATMVFDEVDTGIGGAVAEAVGQTLRALGTRCQVLCVTHLPQVAAQGHRHLYVSKSAEGGTTASRIELLDDAGRIEELARMLGGAEITRATRDHARQMLERAQR